MHFQARILRPLVVAALAQTVLISRPFADEVATEALDNERSRARGATSSSPIAVSPDDDWVWSVNPDKDTVTLFETTRSGLRKVKEIRVGDEPNNLAISPDGRWVYVANTIDGTVSAIRARGSRSRVEKTIRVGTEPYGLAFTPNGHKLYVTNARSNDVSVIDPDDQRVEETIDDVGPEPRGIAITNDGDGRDSDEKVYVTQFLATDRPGVLIGRDDYKEGRVTVISVRDDDVEDVVELAPLADTGFRSNGSALDRIVPANPPAFDFVTGAFPNQLNSIAIKGDRAYVPNTAASPNGPVRFNVNVQGFLSVIDTERDREGRANGEVQTINMNRGINLQAAGPDRVFMAVPWHIAFEHREDAGWVVLASSNMIVRVALDEDGTPTIGAPENAGDAGDVVRIFVGQNPKGIAIDSRDRRAYVMNEVSRDVSVVDLEDHEVLENQRSSSLPAAGSEAARLLIGKALFNSSTGVDLPQLGPLGVTGRRLSAEGWSSCVACHPFGLTDNVVWIFGSGPRRSVPLNASFNPQDPEDARMLNYSAIFDEIQDFEDNMRNTSGGLGLITLADGETPDPTLNAFALPNAGRSERFDAMAAWVAAGIRTPIAPRVRDEDDDERGRRLFARANCNACHGGDGWSSSRRDYEPPPDAADIVNGQFLRFLRQVGTFDAAAVNEIRQNQAAPRGADGFSPPSLLGVGSMLPALHNGSAATVLDVLDNVVHRSAGTGGVDRLSRRRDRENLAAFVASIDADTEPFDITDLLTVDQAKVMEDDSAAESSGAVAWLEPVRNPVHGGATLAFALERAATVDVSLYDVRGRRVAGVARGSFAPGRHVTPWTGRDDGGSAVAAGIYFVRLQLDGTTADVRKLVVSR